MRVYEFARKYNMTSKEVVTVCQELGIEVKAQSKLNDESLEVLNGRLSQGKDTEVKEIKEVVKPTVIKRQKVKKPMLYVVTECEPFTNLGELGKVSKAFVEAQEGDVIVALPKYLNISETFGNEMDWLMDIPVKFGTHEARASIFKLVEGNVTYLFVGNDHYFHRNEIYGFADDVERFAFFNRAILDVLPLLGMQVGEIQVNEWHTSMLPLMLHVDYHQHPYFSKVKTTLNIHNLEYQGWYDASILTEVLGISREYYDNGLTRMGDSVNLLKSGIETAHKVVLTDISAGQMKLDGMVNSGITAVLENKVLNQAV